MPQPNIAIMHKALTARERVRTALEHREPDRVPIDFGGPFSGIHVAAYQKLVNHLGLNEQAVVIDPVQQLAAPSETVLRLLNVDTRYIWPKTPKSFKTSPVTRNRKGQTWLEFIDEWGVTWSAPADNPCYFNTLTSPLAGLSIAEIKEYEFPNGDNPARFEGLRQTALTIRRETDCAIVCGTPASIIEIYRSLRGPENSYTDMVTNPELFQTVADRILQFWLNWFKLFLDELGDLVDVILLADDLAGQHGPLFSPEIYKHFIKPRHATLIQYIKSKTNAAICYHSCGAVDEFIPDLLEIGVDILNPIQTSAKGMDPARLKTRYGSRLVFWGGGTAPDQITSDANLDQLRKDICQTLLTLKPGGGFIFAPTHNFQPTIAPEFLITMFETAAQLGMY